VTELDWLRSEFERCWPWLQAALEREPDTYRKEHVWKALETGDASLWPTPNSCCLVSIKDYPTGRRGLLGWLAGGDLQEIKKTEIALQAYAREMGCHHMELFGRRGWFREFEGYREAAVVLRKDLE